MTNTLKKTVGAVFILLLVSIKVQAQVKIAHWTDSHSSLEDMSQQVLTIDSEGQAFLKENPKGEFIVLVNGDYTSINPLSQKDRGQSSLEILKHMKNRGYTVIFVLGNHDAFDWAGHTNEVELLLEQLKMLRNWGVEILVSNFEKPTKPLKDYISPYYKLNSLKDPSYLIGMTLERLTNKANLRRSHAKVLFKSIRSHEETSRELVRSLTEDQKGPVNFIFSAHEGHHSLAFLSDRLNHWSQEHSLGANFPVLFAGDDHEVTSYNTQYESLVVDGGAYGSISTVTVKSSGKVEKTEHFPITEEGESRIDRKVFKVGEVAPLHRNYEIPNFWKLPLKRLEAQVSATKKQLDRVLFNMNDVIMVDKHGMKRGRNILGTMIANSLEESFREQRPEFEDEDVIVFYNSSSYRLEHFLPKGAVTEFDVRSMYPFPNRSVSLRLKGSQIVKLLKTLRAYYLKTTKGKYTPQLNSIVRETPKGLKILKNGKWKKVKKNNTYVLVLDGWLSQHRYGEGYQIEEFEEVLIGAEPLTDEVFQDILVRHLPDVMIDNGLAEPAQSIKTDPSEAICQSLLAN